MKTRHKKGNYHSWNTGLTKETNEILRHVSEKVSESRKGKTSWNKGISCSDDTKRKISVKNTGKLAWNKGLSKETSDSVLSISNKLTGRPCPVKDWESAKQKEYETRRKNNSFNTSKPEDDYYKYLVDIYGFDDVVRQYRSDVYPFNCDFYVKSIDQYIEYNGSWLHGGHPFDCNSREDNILLQELKEKESSGKPYYGYAVYIWSDLDVRKLTIARENKLNFQFIYPKENLIITQ